MSEGAPSGGSRAVCRVCPHACSVGEGRLGLCGARGNVGGLVASLNYGACTALALDPIEKKPLARFHPGSLVLSYGSYGCNLRCDFCQNSDISMADARGDVAEGSTHISPEQLVAQARELVPLGNIGVALTYNEPLVAPEYLRDVGALLHRCGLLCIVVTNGYAEPDTFEGLIPYIDAVNIDLKCFTEEGYRRVGAPGGLLVVKDNIERAVRGGVHVEVTTLVVPGLSDDEDAFEAECDWLASLNSEMPLHLSRFFPRYKMADALPTDMRLLRAFEKIAQKRLAHVYLGNV